MGRADAGGLAEIGALRAYEPAERARVVQRAFRAAAFRCHPDTNTGTPDAEAFARVTRAAEMLRSGARLDTTLARLWREEVREWTVEQLAEHLAEEGLPEDVVGHFVEHAVNGREVVGVPQWEGNDTDNFIYCLRWLGTDDEDQARRTEAVLRELVGAECGSNFIPRESQLRKPRLWWGTNRRVVRPSYRAERGLGELEPHPVADHRARALFRRREHERGAVDRVVLARLGGART